MKKYFVLYMIPIASLEKMMAETTPEQRKAGMDEWGKWMKKHASEIVDMGAPLGKTKRVSAAGVADVKNEVAGYSIVEAQSHDEAAALFKDNPHFQMQGAYIDILDILPMGM